MGLSLRDCTLDDSALLFSWRNSEIGRRFSRNPGKIGSISHEGWLVNRLSKLETEPFWIILSQDSSVGYIRFDISSEDSSAFNLSILVTTEFQGKGIASEALQMAIQRIRRDFMTFSINAEIHNENLVSKKFFLKSGFVFLSTDGKFNKFRFSSKEM